MSATLEDAVDVHPPTEEPAAAVAREPSGSLETAVVDPASTGERPISSDSLGGSFTDSVKVHGTSTPNEGTTGGHRPAVKQLAASTVLNGRYEIVRRIGGGGMGAVYLAKDRNLGDAPRAVKEMVESHLDPAQHEKAIGDFKRESLLLTSLEHPCIPTIYDYFYDEHSGRFYLVMKYISGGDLASRLRAAVGGRLDEKTVTDWGMQVADVLDYLHSRPKAIIYRDLKPANLMIDGNTGRVMLIDFGIARWVTQQEKGVTAVGTMGYAPPELFSGRVQPASDVYSLGATMFHLLTGADPQDNPLLIFDFTKNPRPRQLTPSMSTEMEQILMRAVEYRPEDRYRTAGELRDELAHHLEKLISGKVSYGMPAPALGGETVQVQTVYCGFCGGRIAADDVYCAHCGARQPLAAVGSSALLPHSVRPTAKLVVAGTTELDASFILQKDSNLLGRTDPHSNIFPEIDLSRFDPETKVSRRHARIWLEGETFLVEDLGSVNGTVINDSVRLAPRQPRVLDSGDKLRVGETTLHFLVG
ncbi:MAG TPA: FHA domain-containing serine/threonine-protein kinase [Pyrinomonadaceae bacterium]|nr:FHA domain-containing serine/threonine-protein kinase [Pyrinomonadaceae bacterium]